MAVVGESDYSNLWERSCWWQFEGILCLCLAGTLWHKKSCQLLDLHNCRHNSLGWIFIFAYILNFFVSTTTFPSDKSFMQNTWAVIRNWIRILASVLLDLYPETASLSVLRQCFSVHFIHNAPLFYNSDKADSQKTVGLSTGSSSVN